MSVAPYQHDSRSIGRYRIPARALERPPQRLSHSEAAEPRAAYTGEDFKQEKEEIQT